MKYLYSFILLFLILNIQAQTPCENGFAGAYPCFGFDLQDQLTEAELGTSFVNDSWGWTDSTTGIEYAIIGLRNRTSFIDIPSPTDVVLLGTLPTHTTGSTWRDIKVYQDYAFIVIEAPGHGMQVFDLTRLRNVTTPQTFTEDAHYDNFGNAHNIVINPENGFAYGVGTTTFSGGPHFVDISDPLNPKAAIDHNGYVLDDLFYLANYRAGMRLIDISNIDNNDILEIGFFDTFPTSNTASFNGGLWNVYPYFSSGNIVLSGGGGFFLIKANNDILSVEENDLLSNEFFVYPNPAQDIVNISSKNNIGTVTLYSVLGKAVIEKDIQTEGTLDISNLSPGIYFLKFNSSTKRLII